jgi:hypothetical protein
MEEILNIDLSTQTAPVIQEVRNKDYIEYSGTDGWKNTYPQFIIDLYNSSSTNAAIINTTAELIAGEDLVIDDEDERDLDAIVKLKKFFANANSDETLHEVIKKISFDFKLQGAFALNIIWSNDRTHISEIRHVGVEKIRVERPDAMGRVRGYYISADWANTRMHKPYRVPAFNPNDRTSPSQILYTGLYSPGMEVYYTCDYQAANNWSLIDQKVASFHLNNISNSFSGSYMFNFSNGVPSQDERLTIERNLAAKFNGSENAGKMIITFSDDKTRTPEVVPLNTSDLHSQYLALQELLVQNILTGHRCTSGTLMGIRSSTGLGNNADEINSAANFYLNTVCTPFQQKIIKVLRSIFRVNDMDMPVSFVQLKPITTRFTNQDLMAVMTQDEIRAELGLPPLKEEVVVKEDLSKVGMIDGKPVFSTKEEALAEAEKIGCKGYHEHEYEGNTVYMACDTHEEIQRFSNKTALEQFIVDHGEDIPEGWEIISEEDAEEELSEFNFEKELNDNYYEFASTGSAYPNRKSGQDQKSKQEKYKDDIYRVRYRYTGSLIGERVFCRQMTNANKIYRKEDIISMGTKAVNPGWGEYGANTYSIWKWKGGALCKHKWFRIILVQEGNRPKNSDKIISSTEAKSRGVKLPRNAKEVSVAPHDMPNHGFVNPELINKYKNV